jgi:hypothetical protein
MVNAFTWQAGSLPTNQENPRFSEHASVYFSVNGLNPTMHHFNPVHPIFVYDSFLYYILYVPMSPTRPLPLKFPYQNFTCGFHLFHMCYMCMSNLSQSFWFNHHNNIRRSVQPSFTCSMLEYVYRITSHTTSGLVTNLLKFQLCL